MAAPAAASPTPQPANGGPSLLELAHVAYAAGQYARALALVDEVLAYTPLDTHALLLGGAAHFQLKHYAECIRYNQRAIAIDPGFAESYGNMGNACKELGNLPEAIAFYMKALSIRPRFADVYNNLASAYLQLGDHAAAMEMFLASLNLNPGMVDAWSNLGNLHKSHGRYEEARRCYLEAIRLRPGFAFAWSNLAALMRECGDLPAALQYYEEALRLQPEYADCWANYGNALREAGRILDARTAYERALQLNPNNALVHGNLAASLYEMGDVRGAIVEYRIATQLQPNSPDCLNNLGNAYRELGQLDESIVCYRTALAINQAHPHAWNNLGNSLKDKGFVKEAVTCYMTACRLLPNFAAGHSNLASVLKEQGHVDAAIAHYNEALRIDPDFADAWSNLGNTMKDIGRIDDAIRCYSTAIVLKPNFADAFSNLASAYKDSGRVEEAIGCYLKALELKPNFPDSLANLVHSLVLVCDWRTRRQDFDLLTRMLSVQIAALLGPDPLDADEASRVRLDSPAMAEAAARALHTQIPAVQPFHSLVYPMSLRQMQRLAQCYALRAKPNAAALGLQPFVHPRRSPGSRLRIGYVSSDFGNHPLSHLMQSVFGMHSRQEFEVFCYALSADDGSIWRTKISSEVEHFVDLSRASFVEAAQRIHSDGIHVLVNLNGYTKGARNEIFALQPAPIQVNYMGFCGTLGADYVQYMIVDRTVVPPAFESFYSEALVHMPHSYFVNDHRQSARDVLDPTKRPSRAAYGIPEDKFVFANFNQIYKLDPSTCRAWCRILQRVPNSVLWLLRFPPAGESNIRMAARAFGVSDDRIIFTDVAAKDEHIRRGVLCDLFLDTPVCNAHTTGCDILWGGVPVVTLPGEKLASRVAASLIAAAGAPECIANSMSNYEELAVHLATNPPALKSIRRRLEDWRDSCPLFDTKRWVMNLERAVRAMWRRHELGLPPAAIIVHEADDGTAAAVGQTPQIPQVGAGGQPHVPIDIVGAAREDDAAQDIAAEYARLHAVPKPQAVLGMPMRPPASSSAALLAAGIVVPGQPVTGLPADAAPRPPAAGAVLAPQALVSGVTAVPTHAHPAVAGIIPVPGMAHPGVAPAGTAVPFIPYALPAPAAPPPGGVPFSFYEGAQQGPGSPYALLTIPHTIAALGTTSYFVPAHAHAGAPLAYAIAGWPGGLRADDASAYVMAPAHVAQSGLPLAALDPRALVAQPAISPMLRAPTLFASGASPVTLLPTHPALAGIDLLSALAGRGDVPANAWYPSGPPAAASGAPNSVFMAGAARPSPASTPSEQARVEVAAPIPLAVHELAFHDRRQYYLQTQLDALKAGHAAAIGAALAMPPPTAGVPTATGAPPGSPPFCPASPPFRSLGARGSIDQQPLDFQQTSAGVPTARAQDPVPVPPSSTRHSLEPELPATMLGFEAAHPMRQLVAHHADAREVPRVPTKKPVLSRAASAVPGMRGVRIPSRHALARRSTAGDNPGDAAWGMTPTDTIGEAESSDLV